MPQADGPDKRQAGDASLEARLFATRETSVDLAALLTPEDQTVQAMDDASPTKWHLAHTTWFFETFILARMPGFRTFDERFPYLFNSYYEGEGPRHPRAERGLLTRPTVEEVLAYRAHVDQGLREIFAAGAQQDPNIAPLLELGVHHEQQHQELLLTDILALFAKNPLHPAYRPASRDVVVSVPVPVKWIDFDGGIERIGHAGAGFAFDNEGPAHDALLQPFRLADRLVTNREFCEFIDDRGYETPSLWLSDGWATVRREGWRAPLYMEERDGAWLQMGLEGRVPREFLRSRCLRALGRQAPADGVRVGSRGASGSAGRSGVRAGPAAAARDTCGRARTDVWGVLAVDSERVSAIPRVPTRGRCRRGIQWQVHDQPDGAARILVRHAARPRAPDLPQLLLSAATLAVHRAAARG